MGNLRQKFTDEEWEEMMREAREASDKRAQKIAEAYLPIKKNIDKNE